MGLFKRGPATTTEPMFVFGCADKTLREEMVGRYRALKSAPSVTYTGDEVTVRWSSWQAYNDDAQTSAWPRNLSGLTAKVVPQQPAEAEPPPPPSSDVRPPIQHHQV
jgi:hypothetical protein